MSIDELVKKHAGSLWLHEWTIRAALTEQAKTHAIELRAYEATVQNLEQRIRELEAQRIPKRWKMVTLEPTDEMISSGCDAANAFRVDMCRAWDAMLMASPEVCSHD